MVKLRTSSIHSRGGLVERRDFLRLTAGGVSAAALAPLLQACNDDEVAGGNGADSISTRITAAAYPIPIHSAPYLVALEEGIFEKHGWDIEEIVGSLGGGTTVRNIVTGNLPIGEVGPPGATLAWLAGAEITMLKLTINTPGEGIGVAMPGTRFESFEDLRGKRVGFTSPGGGTEQMMHLVTEKHGVKDDVELVAGGGLGGGLELLQRGDIDFMWHFIQLWDPDEYKLCWRFEDEIPQTAWACVAAGTRFVEENPELVQRFLDAHAEAQNRVYEDPEYVGSLFAQALEVPEEQGIAAVRDNVEAESFTTGFTEEGLNTMLDGMRAVGAVDEPDEVPIAEVINQSFLPESEQISL